MRAFAMTLAVLCLSGAGPSEAYEDDATERRIIEYIKENWKPGERLIVSTLYNEVFTSEEERAVLDKLNGAFFRVPLFVVEYQNREGRLPTLEDISGQFDFYGPEEADVVLSIMESDPRVPKFLERDPSTREILSIDIEKIKADERFNKVVERTLTGWEGRPIPPVAGTSFDGRETSLADFAGKTVLLYVWFTNCPPCVKIAPELVEIQKQYGAGAFTVLGLNADRVLKLQYDDAYRAESAAKVGVNYPNLHLTPEVRAALGNVNIFPTLFLVDSSGKIARHYVNFQPREVLGPAIEEAMSSSSDLDRD
jgi:thiol-disulfide isomerase/thioredoxin